MKAALNSLLIATALCVSPAGFASSPAASDRATATVEFVKPEDFTDFRLSPYGGKSDAELLGKELQRDINRLAGSILPAGYRAFVRIVDIDMAGEFEPERLPPNDRVRIMKGVYTPKIRLEYSVTDDAGNVVASGERRLTEPAYDMQLRTRPHDHLEIESGMIADLFREIAREIA